MNVSVARLLVCSALAGIGIYAGAACARLFRSDAFSSPALASVPRAGIQLPDPRLSPHDVVRLQVDALRRFQHEESAITQCYVLASPANRAVTGPLDRFIAMVHNPAYGALVQQTAALVGRPEIRDRQATVLVTVLTRNREARVFRFFLSQQTDSPVSECWMTDAVIPESGQNQPEQVPVSSPLSAA